MKTQLQAQAWEEKLKSNTDAAKPASMVILFLTVTLSFLSFLIA